MILSHLSLCSLLRVNTTYGSFPGRARHRVMRVSTRHSELRDVIRCVIFSRENRYDVRHRSVTNSRPYCFELRTILPATRHPDRSTRSAENTNTTVIDQFSDARLIHDFSSVNVNGSEASERARARKPLFQYDPFSVQQVGFIQPGSSPRRARIFPSLRCQNVKLGPSLPLCVSVRVNPYRA